MIFFGAFFSGPFTLQKNSPALIGRFAGWNRSIRPSSSTKAPLAGRPVPIQSHTPAHSPPSASCLVNCLRLGGAVMMPGGSASSVKGGRCENCEGGGLIKIEMHFLPEVYVECEVCHGKRYNRETLEITYKGRNIADVLDLTVDEAARFFRNVPSISEKLNSLLDVGLGYLRLGQAGTTLSGEEAQRVKLATELAKKATGRTVYTLDEPTTGLHFADIEKLLQVLTQLRNAGNTVMVIEHNLEMIKCADWIIDLGPEGGEGGGDIVGEGPPEKIAELPRSHTGQYLRSSLKNP